MANEFIFVYGTLRQECASPMHGVLAQYGEYFSAGTLQGTLYEVKGYPGAIESDRSTELVYGELYRIIDQEKIFAELDDYEECSPAFPHPHEYIRKKAKVSLPEGGNLTAWVYIYNHGVSQLTRIEGGDYMQYLNRP